LVLSLPLTVTATPKRPKLCKSRSRRKASRKGFFAPAPNEHVLVCSPAWARSCAALSTTGVVSSCKRLLETKIQPESPEFGPGHCLPITCGVSMHSPMEDQDCESELPVPGRAAPLFLGVSDGDVGDAPARVRLALWKCLWALDKVGAELVDRDFDLMHYWTARDFLPSGDFLPNGARSGLTKAAKASSEKARLQRMRRAVRAICAFGRWRVPESCAPRPRAPARPKAVYNPKAARQSDGTSRRIAARADSLPETNGGTSGVGEGGEGRPQLESNPAFDEDVDVEDQEEAAAEGFIYSPNLTNLSPYEVRVSSFPYPTTGSLLLTIVCLHGWTDPEAPEHRRQPGVPVCSRPVYSKPHSAREQGNGAQRGAQTRQTAVRVLMHISCVRWHFPLFYRICPRSCSFDCLLLALRRSQRSGSRT
jgi:hypothetical protein